MKKQTIQTLRKVTRNVAALLAALVAAPAAFAASQTWTNAPQNGLWNNTNNWVARALPGALNSTGNGNNGDTATFNSPLVGGIGGAGNPIVPDDATVAAARSRSIGTVLFDTANVGAYVFQSPSPAVLAAAGIPETGYLNVGHNNAIRMNDAVTNSQVFIVPMKVLLPSSTAGIFNLVNNSTNPSATLTISSIMHAGATTRATTFILDGVNTGDNVVTNLSEGLGNATGGFTKQGAGKWIIRGTGTFPGASPLNINAGTLAVQAADAFGVATTATVTNTGILRFDGVTLNQVSLNLRNGGTLQANGTVSVNGVVVGNQAANTCTLSTLNSSDVFTVGTGLAAASIVSGGAADTVLNTAGPGNLIFSQANTYVGKWSFNAKTNQLVNFNALGTGANANVGAGAVLDLTPFGATSFVPTTAGFGGSGAGTVVGSTAAAVVADAGGTLDLTGKNVNLTFTPASFSGDLTRPALHIAQGTLALSGNTFFINNASGTPLGVGTYRLITQASGSVTSSGGFAALISGSGAVGGSSAAIVVSGGNVDLVISIYVPKNLVWSGTGSIWDVATTSDWLNGLSASVFNNSDNVTFNSVGSANPTVSLVGTLAPASVTVDTSANNYTLNGSGQIAGTTSLKKISGGTLDLQTVNTYAGGTVVSNGTLRVGANNAISSVGSGDVAVYSTGVVDLNGFNNTINGLNGDGAVDASAGTSILTIGNNNNGGTFSGSLRSTAGSLALVKAGNGTQTLSASNSLSGGVTVSGGTLVAANARALGTNIATVNAGTLDIPNGLFVGGLTGSAGVIGNNSSASPSAIVIDGGATTTFGGSIGNGTGGGEVSLKLLSGSLTFSANNTYTGGTIVGSGATLGIANSPAGLGGTVIASNSATLSLSGGSGTPGTPTNIITADGATVTFTAGALGKIWGGQFTGAANTTNRYTTTMSFGGDTSFKNFLGLVSLEANATIRFINIPTGAAGGSDNTTFEFSGTTSVVTRDAATVRLGHIRGGSATSGIDGATTAGVIDTYIIGGKNVDSIFHGYLRGSNNLVKAGSAKLVYDGASVTTNTDSATYTNYLFGPSLVAHLGSTTISNGTLQLVVPNNLSNSPSITLAASTAVLDISKMGFVQDQLDEFSVVTNQVLVTNGVMHVYPAQTLAGIGAIQGSVIADSGSTLNLGLTTGTLAVSGSATLNGAVNMNLNRANSPNSSRLTASSFAGSGATLTVTNLGATLVTGDTFQLFSGPVSAFTTVNLPVASADNSITYVWDNKIAVDGTIKVLSGASPVSPIPTNITSSVTGNQLTLSWPSSHTGWTLQAQTNALTTGLTGTWVNVPGSSTTNQVIVTVNPANPTVFYRLTLALP